MNERALTAALILLALAACTSTPSLTPIPAPTATPATTENPTIPSSPTPSAVPTPAPVATPTATPTVQPTATPTATATVAPSPTPTVAPTLAPWPAAKHIAGGGFSQPAVAVDPSGNVHIAATAADNEGIWYLTNASGTWVEQQLVNPWNSDPEMTGSVDEPTLAIDPSDGSVWVAFVYWQCADCGTGWPDGVYMVNNAGGTWSDPVALDTGDGATYPSLAVRDGRMYLAWAVAGDYFHRYGPVGFGTDASGSWDVRQIAKAGAFPRIAVQSDGRIGILFGGSSVRYADQKGSGSFITERLPDTAGNVGSFAHPVIAVDPISGDTWAAWTTHTGAYGNVNDVYVASHGPQGWSDPILAIPDGELIGLGVRDGLSQVTADKSGVTYASDASGSFVEQVIASPSNFSWPDAAFVLQQSGRPLVVIARDIPSNQSGLWFLKGPGV